MEKRIIIIGSVIIVVILIAVGAWWYFSKTNSIIAQPGGMATKVKSSEKSISSFAFAELNSETSEVIDNSKHAVTIIVPSNANITSLTPAISIPPSAAISPNSGAVQNFTNPVVYTITAQDGSTQKYTVTVEKATPQGSGGS